MEKYLKIANKALLGLLMLVPGLMKLFSLTSTAEMLSKITLFSSAPLFWTWILVMSEITFGFAILVDYKLKYSIIPPITILLLGILIVHIGNVSMILLNLVAITAYLMLAYRK